MLSGLSAFQCFSDPSGQRIAMRQGDVVYYIHTDHLGSVSVLSDGSGQADPLPPVSGGCPPQGGRGVPGSAVRYLPYGGLRLGDASTLPTDYTFTGQRNEAGLGLMHYRVRFYSPRLGRFISADTLVPNPGNPQSLNRYSYVLGSPVKYRDPGGHAECVDEECNMVFHPVSGDVVVRNTAGSALYLLIAQISRGQATATDRVTQILDQTAGLGQIPIGWVDAMLGRKLHTHFRGIGGSKGDTGFAPEFRDDYLYAELWGFQTPHSQQVGHFLTAVSMGFESRRLRSFNKGEQTAPHWRSLGKSSRRTF